MLTLVVSPVLRAAPAAAGASTTDVATDTAHAASMARRAAGNVDHRTARTADGTRLAAAAR